MFWAINETQFHATIAIVIFSLGVFGFLARRNGLVVLMSLELMLNGVNLLLVTFGKLNGNPDSSALFMFVVLVAAAEAAVAFSIFVALSRKHGSVYLDDLRRLKG
ncbi:MAG: NADH-quinone oxidoreductase subunit NuoK [Proteobacteria bacterium]|jgi:NADH:ubiquinone oxidoreductase subunit K|nr:NADH-quinone oxidoreductase subunit NuoK [Pseudomonadota bacterium]